MKPFLFGSAAMFAAMYSTQAILPDIGRAFHVSPSATGLTISVLIIALAIGAWFWGPLSDRIGRRRSLVLASALLVVPSVGVALAPSFPALLVMRALQGLCMPGLLTVGVSYIAEVYQPRLGSRAMGYYLSSLVVGGLVGRIGVALVAAASSWRVGLGALALLPLASTLAMRRWLDQDDPPSTSVRRLNLAVIRTMLGNRALVAATLGGSSLFFGFVAAFSYIDYRLERPPFSLSPAATSAVFLLWLAGGIGPLAGRLGDQIGWRKVVLTGMAISTVGLLLSLHDSYLAIGTGLALFALGNFGGVTATQVGIAASTSTDRGVASALYYSVYYTAGGLGGYLPGLAWQAWAWPGVVTVALAGFCVALLALGRVR